MADLLNLPKKETAQLEQKSVVVEKNKQQVIIEKKQDLAGKAEIGEITDQKKEVQKVLKPVIPHAEGKNKPEFTKEEVNAVEKSERESSLTKAAYEQKTFEDVIIAEGNVGLNSESPDINNTKENN